MIIDGMSVRTECVANEWVMIFDKDGYGVDVRITGDREPGDADIEKGSMMARELMSDYGKQTSPDRD